MAKEIRTRQVCKDIKALDKAKAATGHMKHAYVRIRERAGNAQMQGQESETPADYAETKMEHGAARVIHEAVRPIRQQGRRKVKQEKEIRQTAETIKPALIIRSAISPLKIVSETLVNKPIN